MREWSLEGRERSRPFQTKIWSAVVGNSQVVGERDFRSAKCDRGFSRENITVPYLCTSANAAATSVRDIPCVCGCRTARV